MISAAQRNRMNKPRSNRKQFLDRNIYCATKIKIIEVEPTEENRKKYKFRGNPKIVYVLKIRRPGTGRSITTPLNHHEHKYVLGRIRKHGKQDLVVM